MFNTFAKANELALWIAGACMGIHMTFALKASHLSERKNNVETTDLFTQTRREWTPCREQASVTDNREDIYLLVADLLL